MWKVLIFVLLQVIISSYGSPVYNKIFTNSTTNHTLAVNKDKHIHATSSLCECLHYDCGCCFFMNVPKLHLNDSGCANMTYLPEQYGLRLTVKIDNWELFNETISARSPPALCFGEEYLPIGGQICLKFYDLDATRTSFHGCAEVYAKLHHVVLAKYDLGCFNIGKIWSNATLHFNKAKDVYIPQLFLQ